MKNLTWIKTLDFAHRGLHNSQHPENTISAFEHAVENNFDIEFDIQMTKDGKLVVIHDNNLKRLCNADINIQDSNYSDIKHLTILESNQHPELLSTVLQSIPPSTHLLIELKKSFNHKLMVQTFIDEMSNFPHTYAIHSFDPRIVYDFKKLSPNTIRGLISQNYKSKWYLFYLTSLRINFLIQPDFINYHYKDLPTKRLDHLHKHGMCIISYTVHAQEELDYVRKRYDNAVFEDFITKKREL